MFSRTMVLACVALLACTFATLDAKKFKASLVGRETYQDKLIKERKWDEWAVMRQVKAGMFRPEAQAVGQARQPFYDYSDAAYLGKVTIGTPEQEFQVILDTGSSNFWITDKNCGHGASSELRCESYCAHEVFCRTMCDPRCCTGMLRAERAMARYSPCDGKNQYDADASSTFADDGRPWQIAYGTGAAAGTLASDTVALGDKGSDQLVIPKTTFGRAIQLADFFIGQPLDGILGLAFRSIAVDNVQPVFQHAMEQGLVEQPIFTVWLTREGAESQGKKGGLITYGGHDEEHCSKNVTYVKLSHETYWIFDIEAVVIDGKKYGGRLTAISDTGTSLIAGPQEHLEHLVRETGARMNPKYHMYQVPCDQKFEWGIQVNGQQFTVSEKNMLLEVEPGSCLLAYQVYRGGPGSPDFILGDAFIREYCQIYEVKEGAVGFAKALK